MNLDETDTGEILGSRFLAYSPSYERQRQVLSSSKIQGRTSAAIGTVTIPPGGQSDAHVHVHEHSDEFWILTKG